MPRSLYALASALSLFACSGTEPEPQARWTGLILRSCGPTDGPAVAFEIDTLPMACGSHTIGAFHYQVDLALDSLRAPMTFTTLPSIGCQPGSDPLAESTRLEITGLDSASATVHFLRVRSHPCTAPAARPDTLEGTAQLRLCREAPSPMCG